MIHLLLLALLAGGTVASTPSTQPTSGYAWYFTSDTHWDSPFAGGDRGRESYKKGLRYVAADDSAAFMVHGGDFRWIENASADQDKADSLIWHLQDSLTVQVYPVIGNHDEAYTDTSTGFLFNSYAAKWPHFFKPYRAAYDRGRRWYGVRPLVNGIPANILFVAVNNVADTPSGGYYAENPRDGSGVAVDDFDGIRDSTSTQQQDIRNFIRANYESGDWVIVAGHRTVDGVSDVTSVDRPDLEGAASDTSLYKWLDDYLSKKWIVLQGDAHEILLKPAVSFGSGPGHYTVSATFPLRGLDASRLSGSELAFALADSVYCDGCAMEDSLGVQGGSIENLISSANSNPLFWRFVVNGTTITAQLVLFSYDYDEATVFQTTLTQ